MQLLQQSSPDKIDKNKSGKFSTICMRLNIDIGHILNTLVQIKYKKSPPMSLTFYSRSKDKNNGFLPGKKHKGLKYTNGKFDKTSTEYRVENKSRENQIHERGTKL